MMQNRNPVVRILACAARGDVDGAVRALDRLTPWKGFAEIAADVAGPPLVRALVEAMQDGREIIAAELRALADELDATT
jgi:hypothetical protein